MAKKATTIVLILVVVFLLASTVYVSIILTSDQGTTPKQSKASEIDATLEEASQEATTELETPTPGPLAYVNPSPTGGTGSESAGLEPTNGIIPSPIETSSSSATTDTSNLPETGLGQPTKTPTVTPSSTMTPSPTLVASSSAIAKVTQAPPTTMPVAGAMTTTIIASLIAGLTIFLAFLL